MKLSRSVFISRIHGGTLFALEPLFPKNWDRFDFVGLDADWAVLHDAKPESENKIKCHAFVVDRTTMTIRPEEK